MRDRRALIRRVAGQFSGDAVPRTKVTMTKEPRNWGETNRIDDATRDMLGGIQTFVRSTEALATKFPTPEHTRMRELIREFIEEVGKARERNNQTTYDVAEERAKAGLNDEGVNWQERKGLK